MKDSTDTPNPSLQVQPFSFTGNGREYFGIWIVNILLSIATLGIYSAWAKVRNKQYFYGNTFLDNTSFEYTATPIQILKGRIIAVGIFVIFQIVAYISPSAGNILLLVLFFFTPWIIMKSIAFNARYSQYRNINFGFSQNLKQAFIVLLGLPLLILLTVGLIYPYINYRINKYFISFHRYGTSDFNFTLDSSRKFYIIYGKALLALIVAGPIMGAILMTQSASLQIPMGKFELSGTVYILFFIYLLFYFFLYAYIKANIYNLTSKHALIKQHRLYANMRTMELFWIHFTNTLGTVLTLGLFIPWARVRLARYRAEHTALYVKGDLNTFIADSEKEQRSLVEELGEVFDIDINI